MKIGLVGLPGSGKSTVFGALTGQAVVTGYASRGERENLGSVKVSDPRVDALAGIYSPKKIIYAEIRFTDLGAGRATGIDRRVLKAMRNVDALCQVLRAFPDELGAPGDPVAEIRELETETLLADMEVIEQRIIRLGKDRSDPRGLALLERIQAALENEQPIRRLTLSEEELKSLSGYALLTLKPLLLVVNVSEEALGGDLPAGLQMEADQRRLGLITLSAPVEMDIARLDDTEQREFVESLGLSEPARNRFIRAAFELIDLISMLTVGPDECRAWPIRRGLAAPKAAGKIHSDIERVLSVPR